jgi:hypothetical protein
MATGRQCVMLQPYVIRSTSSPGAVNAAATFSSTTTTTPWPVRASRQALRASTGRAMSCRQSSSNTASKGPSAAMPAASARTNRAREPTAAAWPRASSTDAGSLSIPTTSACG